MNVINSLILGIVTKVYDDIVLNNTKIQPKQLRQIHRERREWYMTAEEALELGVIDEIL